MQAKHTNSTLLRAIALLVALGCALSGSAFAKDKKNKDKEAPQPASLESQIDVSKLVWPQPPDVARIKYVVSLRGETAHPPENQPKKKSGWMDRLAGIESKDSTEIKPVRVLAKPYGAAIDSQGKIYVADSYVGAVFIFDTTTANIDFIRNGKEARFKDILGLAIDDGDRLFVSDAGLRQVSVFDKTHKLETVFGSDVLARPGGIAIDRENRFVYVVDTQKQLVAVFDADSYKFLRNVGGPPKSEADDSPGTFTVPTNVAVDQDGNVYVADTLNNRIQIFDADGNFVSMFGKNGDGPEALARPKGVAVDSDGHIWVADSLQDRVHIFDKEGHLLAFFGEHGKLPGQFGLPTGLCIDKQNRVVVTEQLKGRAQVFQYVPDTEAGKVAGAKQPGTEGAK